MATYCFTLNIDGQEQPTRSQLADTREEAIALGRFMLEAAASDFSPVTAYCAIAQDEGVDDEPLGSWDYDPVTGAVTWSAVED
jgi:hypothetical protein